MSMTRQMALLIATLLLLACGGAWGLHLWSLQVSLRAQLQLRDAERATVLALSLSQLQGDEAALRSAVERAFDGGQLQHVALRLRDGMALVERRAERPEDGPVPHWFSDMLSLDTEDSHAAVTHGGQEIGTLWLHLHRDWAVQALWQAAWRTAGWLALLLLLGSSVAAWRLRRWRAPLRQMAAQAQALQDGRFQFTPEPRDSELRPMVRSMNALVTRLADQFAAQSSQVHTLQRLAHADAVTGLARRDAFLRRLALLSESPECQGLTLLMLRLRNLGLLNEVAGHENVDGFLGAVGDMLDDYPSRVNGALAGRLNGTDLAVLLPATGVVRDTAQALADTLSALAERSLPSLEFAIGAVETAGPMALADLLSSCDTSLAQAEWRSHGRSANVPHGDVVVRQLQEATGADGDASTQPGSRGWRTRISAALDAGRVSVDIMYKCLSVSVLFKIIFVICV